MGKCTCCVRFLVVLVSTADMLAGNRSLLDSWAGLETVFADAPVEFGCGRGRRMRMGHRVTCRSRPPKQDIVNVCFPAGNSITVGIEKIPWVRFGGRLLPQSYVISKASRAGVASGGDIDQKVAPETHYMVFKVAVAAILERKAYPSVQALVASAG